MDDLEKLKKAPYMSIRMYLIKQMGEKYGISLEYIFGLFDYYNKKNSGKWFWQKAKLTGTLKDSFDKFNAVMDDLVRSVKRESAEVVTAKMENAQATLQELIEKMERSLEVNRDEDRTYISSHIDNNLRTLIDDSLKAFR